MKTKTLFFYALMILFGSLLVVSCDDDDDDDVSNTESTFSSLESPYLICASRNPGGVGFDFEYDGETGGANNLDSLTVDDFAYDVKILTIKGEKTDGSLGGAPYIQLSDDAMAVNYSAVDTTCVGTTAFENLTASNVLSYIMESDDDDFDPTSVETGTTGSPLMANLLVEYKKLVIGQRWKATAYNEIDEDELVWIIQTSEGKLVKFIVTDFPANPAPTTTGYIAVEWDFL